VDLVVKAASTNCSASSSEITDGKRAFSRGGQLVREIASVQHEEPVLSPMLSFLREFWSFLRVRKKHWLLPIFIMMTIFGGLIMLTQGSAVAPFIYTLF
jgi:hypothetical protein